MFDEKSLQDFEKGQRSKKRKDVLDLDDLTEDEMWVLYMHLESKLPPIKLSEINLEHELLMQFRTVKTLQAEIRDDEDIPPNQKAVVANQVAGTLQQLIKMQEDMRKSETLKLMEACLIDSIKTLPDDIKNTFFADYEARAKRAGLC